MSKILVMVQKMEDIYISVEANDESEALKIAKEKMCSGAYRDEAEIQTEVFYKAYGAIKDEPNSID